ncbi:MAG: FtsX-like permease family protein, partial [Gemmatimonadota bacterium]
QRIDPDYFETLGMPMLAGAMPRVGTVGDERPTVVVNRALAQRLGSAIIGNTIRYSRQMDAIVAGVVEDGQESSPQQVPSAAVYEVRGDWERWPRLYLVARVTTGSEEAAAAQFVQRMRDRYPAHVPPHVSNLRVQLEALFSPQRYIANAALGIGAVQLVLAALGLYSLLLYATLARMREIGLRVALGAKPRSAGLAVMKEGLHFVLTGAVLGITLGIPAAIFASRNFVGADAADPVPLAAALLGITIAAAAAAYVPMRRAARVQPMSALRQE